mmetsp:Transcript_1540/g.3971  ORF Transcript_1540/g.3971 Transcript_1540/m.3971 type:complete len:106 (-) Transcript_1540:63-380(-)
MASDFEALQRTIGRHYGLASLGPDLLVKLGHSHGSATGRARLVLPTPQVRLLREYFAQEYECIAWLADQAVQGYLPYGGKGGKRYYEDITAETNQYAYEAPLEAR